MCMKLHKILNPEMHKLNISFMKMIKLCIVIIKESYPLHVEQLCL